MFYKINPLNFLYIKNYNIIVLTEIIWGKLKIFVNLSTI